MNDYPYGPDLDDVEQEEITAPEGSLAQMIQQNTGPKSQRQIDMEVKHGADRPAFQDPDAHSLPDQQFSNTRARPLLASQRLTLRNLKYIIDTVQYEVKYNVMTADVDIFCRWDGRKLTEDEKREAENYIQDWLTLCTIGNKQDFYELLFTIARRDSYHPMLNWIESAEWDGEDRLQALCETLPVSKKEVELRNIYVKRWLLQVIEAVAGWDEELNPCWNQERSLPQVLILGGNQGAGKTSWFGSLCPWVKTEAELHLNTGNSKDHQIDLLQYPIAELSEIDSTFKKSDVSSLKTFISRRTDSLRPPYGRKAIKRQRMTVLGGSVNHSTFLMDNTGSRRFLPVWVTGDINFKHGIDMQQLFAQVFDMWCEGESYFLTAEEAAMRDIRNEIYTAADVESELLSTHFHRHSGKWRTYCAMTCTEIMKMCGIAMTPIAKGNTKVWLEKNLGPESKIEGRYRCWAVPVVDEKLYAESDQISARRAWLRTKKYKIWGTLPAVRRHDEPKKVRKNAEVVVDIKSQFENKED